MATEDQAKLRKRLEALLKLPENAVCVDCRKRGPRWASANLGVFMCIECSGIHRNLGVHISFVRSVNLDTWTKKQVDHMEEWGNKRANDYYEANVPASVIRPKEGDAVRVVERFIRDKYEHKRFIASSVPPVRRSAAPEQETVPPRRASVNNNITAPAAPKQPVAAAPVAPAPVKQPDLLDMMDDSAPAPTATTASNEEFGGFVTANNPPVTQTQSTASNQGFSAFDSPTKAPAPFVAQTSSSQDFMDFMSAPPAPPQQVPASSTAFPTQSMPMEMAPAPPRPQASADAILSLYSAQMNRGPPNGNGLMSPPNNGMMNMGGGYPTHMGMMQQPPAMLNRGAPPMVNGALSMPPYGGGGMYGQQPMTMNAPPQNPFQPQMMMQQQQPNMMMGQAQGYPQGQGQYQQPPQNPFRPQQPQQGNGMMMNGGMGMMCQPPQQQQHYGGWNGNR